METDFGVIYERPPMTPIMSNASQSALSISPDAGDSGFSLSAVSLASENMGIGMAPKVQEKMRRKSVSSKSKEVVLIGVYEFEIIADDQTRSDQTGR
jgi:hypothetical protein